MNENGSFGNIYWYVAQMLAMFQPTNSRVKTEIESSFLTLETVLGKIKTAPEQLLNSLWWDCLVKCFFQGRTKLTLNLDFKAKMDKKSLKSQKTLTFPLTMHPFCKMLVTPLVSHPSCFTFHVKATACCSCRNHSLFMKHFISPTSTPALLCSLWG